MVEVRVLTRADWRAFREVRLRALAGDPDAFGMTYADVVGQADDVWRQRVEGHGPVVVAFGDDGEPLGMGGAFEPVPDHPLAVDGAAFVWGMWVDPAHRGEGIGAAILRTLTDHQDRRGRPCVLHVTEGNAARGLYLSHGFAPTGHRQPLRPGSALYVEELRRPVGPRL